MAVTIDYLTLVINVPRADMTLVQASPEIRQLNINDFRLELKDLEDDPDGMAFLRTHNHNPPVTVGGVTLSRVVEIINGYTITFEDGQYAVNLVGANSNIADVANVNQVSIRSANSAGLQDLSLILTSAYNDAVVVDLTNGQAGTSVPVGTRTTPSNNFADALTIAQKDNLNQIIFTESTIIPTGFDFSRGYIFRGDSSANVQVTVASGAEVTNCEFVNCTLSGFLTSSNTIRESNLLDVQMGQGFIFDSTFTNILTVASGEVAVFQSYSNKPSDSGLALSDVPVFKLQPDVNLTVREYTGGLALTNMAGTSDVSLDMEGFLSIDPTCTGGNLSVRGRVGINDNSAGTIVNFTQVTNRPIEIDDREDIKGTVEDMNLI